MEIFYDDKEVIPFKELEAGDGFLYDGRKFLKIRTVILEAYNSYNSICLENGKICSFLPHQLIKKVIFLAKEPKNMVIRNIWQVIVYDNSHVIEEKYFFKRSDAQEYINPREEIWKKVNLKYTFNEVFLQLTNNINFSEE